MNVLGETIKPLKWDRLRTCQNAAPDGNEQRHSDTQQLITSLCTCRTSQALQYIERMDSGGISVRKFMSSAADWQSLRP